MSTWPVSTLPLRAPSPWWRRWPLPALAAWAATWLCYLGLKPALESAVGHAFGPAAALLALMLSLGLALQQPTWPRRLWVGGGFPLSAALTATAGGAAWPAWAWLLPPLLMLAVYPMRAWRDAPVFPTPAGSLVGLARQIALPAGARVLDAGCGLGHGLRALHQAWPQAAVNGVEWSRPLALWSRWRCRFATVRQGDMWHPGAWDGLALVYLFQRPESMQRAWDKACREMPGGWLVSLEFAVPGRAPDRRHALPAGREVLAWRVPGPGRALNLPPTAPITPGNDPRAPRDRT